MLSKQQYHGAKLQALVYDILPSTTAVFGYAIGSRILSANEQFFVGAQTVVSLLQTQIKQGVLFIAANKVYTSTNKITIFESRRNTFFLFFLLSLFFSFLQGVDASRIYVSAWALGCFYSHISSRTFPEGADHIGGQLRGIKECPFNGITKSGRVWRKVPESDARSVPWRLMMALARRTGTCFCLHYNRTRTVRRLDKGGVFERRR